MSIDNEDTKYKMSYLPSRFVFMDLLWRITFGFSAEVYSEGIFLNVWFNPNPAVFIVLSLVENFRQIHDRTYESTVLSKNPGF